MPEIDDKYIKEICEWLKTEKHIISITLEDLTAMVPEYEAWKEQQKQDL